MRRFNVSRVTSTRLLSARVLFAKVGAASRPSVCRGHRPGPLCRPRIRQGGPECRAKLSVMNPLLYLPPFIMLKTRQPNFLRPRNLAESSPGGFTSSIFSSRVIARWKEEVENLFRDDILRLWKRGRQSFDPYSRNLKILFETFFFFIFLHFKILKVHFLKN